MTTALAAKKKRRRRPSKVTDSHRPHWSLARVAAWLSVHGLPEPGLVDALAIRLAVDPRSLSALCTNLRLAPTVDVALSLTASAAELAARPRPAGTPPVVRSATSDEVLRALHALPPAPAEYLRRIARVNAR